MKYENISSGGVTGNLKPDFQKTMKLYLAGTNGRRWTIEEYMKLFLAGQAPWKDEGLYEDVFSRSSIYILESFYYADEWVEKHIPLFKDFLLDSGAFTFFSAKPKNVNWEEYVDRYADFINRNKVSHFFELDIDKLIGYDNVLKLRKRLETKTGKQCIPVWHKFRGKENFLSMILKKLKMNGMVNVIYLVMVMSLWLCLLTQKTFLKKLLILHLIFIYSIFLFLEY